MLMANIIWNIKRRRVWKPPVLGFIKENIDGFFLGSSGRGDIGSIFKNLEGGVLLQFSKEVYVDSAIYPKVLTLWEWLLVMTTSRWAALHFLVFESNTESVVAWVATPVSAP